MQVIGPRIIFQPLNESCAPLFCTLLFFKLSAAFKLLLVLAIKKAPNQYPVMNALELLLVLAIKKPLLQYPVINAQEDSCSEGWAMEKRERERERAWRVNGPLLDLRLILGERNTHHASKASFLSVGIQSDRQAKPHAFNFLST